MLNWPSYHYKFTLGIGGLALAGMLSERWRGTIPDWAGIVVAMLPFAVFIFIRVDELPPRVARYAHIFASLWYLATFGVLLADFVSIRPLPGGWFVFPLIAAIGLVPCATVLSRVVRGRYLSHDESTTEDDAWR